MKAGKTKFLRISQEGEKNFQRRRGIWFSDPGTGKKRDGI
jgi:hypothetical protein